MSQPEESEQECVKAFIEGNKQDAERLLPHKYDKQLNSVLTTAAISICSTMQLVNVVTEIATKYNCDVNCKDDEGTLHYTRLARIVNWK